MVITTRPWLSPVGRTFSRRFRPVWFRHLDRQSWTQRIRRCTVKAIETSGTTIGTPGENGRNLPLNYFWWLFPFAYLNGIIIMIRIRGIIPKWPNYSGEWIMIFYHILPRCFLIFGKHPSSDWRSEYFGIPVLTGRPSSQDISRDLNSFFRLFKELKPFWSRGCKIPGALWPWWLPCESIGIYLVPCTAVSTVCYMWIYL